MTRRKRLIQKDLRAVPDLVLCDIKRIGAFRQFDRTVQEQQGMGLGLSLAKAQADWCGARFELTSEREKGTRVEVEFQTAG